MQGLWWQGVQDDTADQLILAAHKLSSTRERTMAYSRGLSWLHDHPHWLYLYQPAKLYAHRPEVLGVGMNHAGLLTLPHEVAWGVRGTLSLFFVPALLARILSTELETP